MVGRSHTHNPSPLHPRPLTIRIYGFSPRHVWHRIGKSWWKREMWVRTRSRDPLGHHAGGGDGARVGIAGSGTRGSARAGRERGRSLHFRQATREKLTNRETLGEPGREPCVSPLPPGHRRAAAFQGSCTGRARPRRWPLPGTPWAGTGPLGPGYSAALTQHTHRILPVLPVVGVGTQRGRHLSRTFYLLSGPVHCLAVMDLMPGD